MTGRIKNLIKGLNPFNSTGFLTTPIRKQRSDYFVHALFHGRSGKIAKPAMAVTALGLFLTSFVFANAAPTANPPSGNISPNFTEVTVSTKSGTNDPTYFESKQVEGLAAEPQFSVTAQKSTTLSNKLEVGGSSQQFLLQQQYSGGLNTISLAKNLGILMLGQEGFNASGGTGALNLSAGTNAGITATNGNINLSAQDINPTASDDFTLTAGDDINLTSNGDGNITITATGDDITLRGNKVIFDASDTMEFRNARPYFHNELLLDTASNSAIGFVGGTGGRMRNETRIGTPFARNTAQSGRITETCNYNTSDGNTNARIYGYAMACGYQIMNATSSGSVSVSTSTSTNGNSCYYDWTASNLNSTVTTSINTSTLCYRSESVGL